jgi:hypothetical protein
MNEWYVLDRGDPEGPYSLNELRTMLRDGDVGGAERVRHGPDGESRVARDVPELASAASVAPRRRGLRQPANHSNSTVWGVVLAVFAGFALLSCLVLVPAVLLPSLQHSRTVARRSLSQDNLHNIAIGLHNYESIRRAFPPGGVFAADGADCHGWPTYLLPYVEQAPLYAAMDVDHTRWQDPRLDPWLRTTIFLYLNPDIPQTNDSAGHGLIHYSGNNHVLYQNSSTRLVDILDGASNTLFVGEIGADFPVWGSPKNFRDPGMGVGGGSDDFGRSGAGGAHFVLVDARVSFISESTSADVLQKLATPAGGEIVAVP